MLFFRPWSSSRLQTTSILAAILSHQIEPQWDGESKATSHLLFFQGERCRQGLPHDLDREMEGIRRKGEEVEEVSIGLNGDWFLRTDARHGTFPPISKPRTPINPTYPLLKQETMILQHSKQRTGAGTWSQTLSNSCSSSNRPVSHSHSRGLRNPVLHFCARHNWLCYSAARNGRLAYPLRMAQCASRARYGS